MFDILDHLEGCRNSVGYLDQDWFWAATDISQTNLEALIKHFDIGSEHKGYISGWQPLDYWKWSDKITIFYGIWTLNDDEKVISEIRVWYMAVASFEHDICPSMMCDDIDNGCALMEIKRGLSPIKWLFLNDPDKADYFISRMKNRIEVADLLYNGVDIELLSTNKLLRYVIDKWLPDIDDFDVKGELIEFREL